MPQSTFGQTPVVGPYPYCLSAHNRHTGCFERTEYARLSDLARAVSNLVSASHNVWGRVYDVPVATSPRGKLLDVHALAAWGARLARTYGRWTWPRREGDAAWRGYEFRRTPVPGVHAYHGASCFRRVRTTAERRMAALVLREEGEVAPRAARNARNLPNSWDDYMRGGFERCWKNQHKGRKAWDR